MNPSGTYLILKKLPMFPGVRIKPPLLAEYLALSDLDVQSAAKPSRPALDLLLNDSSQAVALLNAR